MKAQALSGVARPLDFAYPGNLWIALATAGTFAGVLVWHALAGGTASGFTGGDWMTAAGAAARAGLGVFLAWAICRELAPDLAGAAMAASVLSIAAILFFGLPGIGAGVVVLLALRVLNRTTGVPATPLDAALLLGLGVWVALEGGWVYLAGAAAALVGDALLPPRRMRWLALAGAAAAFGLLLLLRAPEGRHEVSFGLGAGLAAVAAAVLLSLLLLPAMRAAAGVQAVGDLTGRPLTPTRVRAGQALALGVGVLAAVERGFAGLVVLTPLWSAVIAAGGFAWLPRRGVPAGEFRPQ
jgi:hypothetical protein